MKKMRMLFITLAVLFFAGCYEVNESIVINNDGSGTYTTKMDMSQLVDMMQTFAGEDEMTKEGLDRPIDTTIAMKDVIDSAKDLTDAQRALFKEGKLNLQMNIKEKIFKINTDIPFKNFNDLQLLMGDMGGSSGLPEVFKNIFNKGGANKDSADNAQEPDLPAVGNIFTVQVQNGLISRKVDTAKYNALMAKPEMGQMKEISNSGIEIMYTTTISLPRPVKEVDNPMLKLSNNKKTITFQYNLLDLLQNPEKYDYSIQY